MPRKKTEELAVMPEAPALPVVPKKRQNSRWQKSVCRKPQPILLWRILYLQRVFSLSLRKW